MAKKRNDEEQWRDVPGYEGLYQVSSWGKVKSLSRQTRNGPGDNHWMWSKDRILAAPIDARGYRYVGLPRFAADGQATCTYKNHRVHLLVLAAFVGPLPQDQMGRHLDNNKLNNRLDNLAYGTHQDNMNDKFVHGTNPAGSKNPGSKLSEDDVLAIRNAFVRGATQTSLALEYHVSVGSVCNIVHGKSWQHVTMPPKLLRYLEQHPVSASYRHRGDRRVMTEAQVVEIRQWYDRHKKSVASTARHFSLPYGSVRGIITGRTWRSLLEQK
jgi:hypothetical protein